MTDISPRQLLFKSNYYCLLIIYSIFPTVLAQRESIIYKMLKDKPMPTNNETGPLEVHMGFYVESMGNFRATEMTFDMDMYLYMSWRDENMKHNESGHVLINDKAILDKIWTPDLYFANSRSAYFHEVTVHNFNMYINPAGVISYGTRVTLNLACNLNLRNYPLDSQQCYVKIISYAHVQSEMKVRWFSDEPIRYNPEIKPPEFRIQSFDKSYCNGTFHYTLTHNSSRIGNFSCLLGIIRLEREIGFHLVQSFIPTALIVAISWVSFFIDRRAVPARVSLSFTTLLTLSTQGNGIRYQLPAVSYAKAIDLYFGVCMIFIFGVLLEFALVNSYMRRANKYNHMAEKMMSGYSGKNGIYPSADCDSEYDEGPSRFYAHMNKNSAQLMYKALGYSRKALQVDKIARVAFPSAFTLFNLFYWVLYLHAEKNEELER